MKEQHAASQVENHLLPVAALLWGKTKGTCFHWGDDSGGQQQRHLKATQTRSRDAARSCCQTLGGKGEENEETPIIFLSYNMEPRYSTRGPRAACDPSWAYQINQILFFVRNERIIFQQFSCKLFTSRGRWFLCSVWPRTRKWSLSDLFLFLASATTLPYSEVQSCEEKQGCRWLCQHARSSVREKLNSNTESLNKNEKEEEFVLWRSETSQWASWAKDQWLPWNAVILKFWKRNSVD